MCASKTKQEAQNPLILRCHRLMEAFAKSDDERDFFIDRLEGFLIYVDLDKPQNELDALQKELTENLDRYCQIPKLSFYETKKIMEGFVNEKVYDIDTKEKLLDIIQSKEARENFLEFIYDHHSEQEKWQQFYQERSRIRIIEWLRLNHFHFVFEEDLDLPRQLVEKLKHSLFQSKVGKDILAARKNLFAKAKTYYSNEALNPRPKRGRPPKQAAKPEIEPQVTIDIFTTVPTTVRPFLFVPNIQSSHFSAFSSKFDTEDDLLTNRRQSFDDDTSISQKLASLRTLSNRWAETQNPPTEKENNPYAMDNSFDDEDDEDDDEDFTEKKQKKTKEKPIKAKAASKSAVVTKATKPAKPEKPKAKRIIPKAKKEAMPTKGKVLKKIMPKKES
ncbi:UPF0158 protein [Candidatus Protochlamydia amoebophila]|uniref:UPF0158 family protein n=1 Tax=Candidatus Protochlamydia amoebophila TaxID=362787 RepID=UPI001BC9EC05|nr:UPF0158 family protein [Candidatus Protochlamydia amoebophila]MBS4164253.1 UPF0158 protein [Candidatus Protochlamydia amoebophila]